MANGENYDYHHRNQMHGPRHLQVGQAAPVCGCAALSRSRSRVCAQAWGGSEGPERAEARARDPFPRPSQCRWRSPRCRYTGSHCRRSRMERAAGSSTEPVNVQKGGANIQSRIPEERGHGAVRNPVHLGAARASIEDRVCCQVLARRAGGAGLSYAAGISGVAPLGSARAVRRRAPRWRRLGPRGPSSSARSRHAAWPDNGCFLKCPESAGASP